VQFRKRNIRTGIPKLTERLNRPFVVGIGCCAETNEEAPEIASDKVAASNVGNFIMIPFA